MIRANGTQLIAEKISNFCLLYLQLRIAVMITMITVMIPIITMIITIMLTMITLIITHGCPETMC